MQSEPYQADVMPGVTTYSTKLVYRRGPLKTPEISWQMCWLVESLFFKASWQETSFWPFQIYACLCVHTRPSRRWLTPPVRIGTCPGASRISRVSIPSWPCSALVRNSPARSGAVIRISTLKPRWPSLSRGSTASSHPFLRTKF